MSISTLKKTSHNKGMMNPTGSTTVAIEESIGNATYMTRKVKAKQSNFEDEYTEYQCSAIRQRIIQPRREKCMELRKNAQDVVLST